MRRSLLFFISPLLFFTLFPRSYAVHSPDILVRQILPPPPPPPTSTLSSPPPTTTTPTSTPTSTSTTSTPLPPTSSPSPTSTPPSTTPVTPPPTSTTPVITSQATQTQAPPLTDSPSTSVVFVTTSSSSSNPTSTSNDSSPPPTSIGTGSIIGLSVAGGIAVLGIVAFFVWKLTRKRFSDFDDNEAIKWPELNTHGADSHPLPVNNTGRAGIDTGSDHSLSRVPSMSTGYLSDVQSSTTVDPYAVPPLPHLNPNQPYRDDPSPAPYYDPYRGPVPNTFNDTIDSPVGTGWTTAEAIPMTQMAPNTRARSPGPQMAFESGRGSPAPGMMGRQSPGPYTAYGDRSRSPGPAVAMGGVPPPGRRSPGPQAAYRPS